LSARDDKRRFFKKASRIALKEKEAPMTAQLATVQGIAGSRIDRLRQRIINAPQQICI
jgi:hypothetical protein